LGFRETLRGICTERKKRVFASKRKVVGQQAFDDYKTSSETQKGKIYGEKANAGLQEGALENSNRCRAPGEGEGTG